MELTTEQYCAIGRKVHAIVQRENLGHLEFHMLIVLIDDLVGEGTVEISYRYLRDRTKIGIGHIDETGKLLQKRGYLEIEGKRGEPKRYKIAEEAFKNL